MSLLKKVIRVAHANPELRPTLLPLILAAQFDAGEIGDTQAPAGGKGSDAAKPWAKGQLKQEEFSAVQDKTGGSLLREVIKLAHSRPETRKALLPLIRAAQFNAGEIGDHHAPAGGSGSDAAKPWAKGHLDQREWDEVQGKAAAQNGKCPACRRS